MIVKKILNYKNRQLKYILDKYVEAEQSRQVEDNKTHPHPVTSSGEEFWHP